MWNFFFLFFFCKSFAEMGLSLGTLPLYCSLRGAQLKRWSCVTKGGAPPLPIRYLMHPGRDAELSVRQCPYQALQRVERRRKVVLEAIKRTGYGRKAMNPPPPLPAPPPPPPSGPHCSILAQFHLQNTSLICVLALQTDSAASGLHLSLVLLVPEHISPPARQRQFGLTMNHAWQISSLLSVSVEFNRVLY